MWLDKFVRIPFGKYSIPPVSIQSTNDEKRAFLINARNILDEVAYGLEDAKAQIMQLVGRIVVNPTATGCAIGLEGPPGTGITTLIKEGLGRIFNRPTKFISLGGAIEGGELEGHSHVYVGSASGTIVNTLIHEQCMDPIFVMDEADKLTESTKGAEVTQVLMRMTDVTQNMSFGDKYFDNIELDISRSICVFSYNDITKIDPILLDRMYTIKTGKYSEKQKIIIVQQYMLPKILSQLSFQKEDIVFENKAISQIIDRHCASEHGVRNLKRCIETICTKLNLSRLLKSESESTIKTPMNTQTNEPPSDTSKLINEYMLSSDNVVFPYTVTTDTIFKLLPVKNCGHQSYFV